MNPNPPTTNIEPIYRTMTIVWVALLVSQALLLVVIYFAKPEIFQFDFSKSLLGENSLMVIVLGVLSISLLVISFVIRKILLNRATAGQNAQNVALVGTAMILGCALCEAISLFGIVMVFAFSYQYFFLWFAVGICGTILHFPRRDNLVAASYKRVI